LTPTSDVIKDDIAEHPTLFQKNHLHFVFSAKKSRQTDASMELIGE